LYQSYRDGVPASSGKGAVEGIAYDAAYDRVACICEKSSQIWKIRGAELVPVLPSPFISAEGYGKSIQFHDSGASVVMYYLDTHEWYVLFLT
jgi:hypothetical protein